MNIILLKSQNNWKKNNCKYVKNTESKKAVEYGSNDHQLFFRRVNSQVYITTQKLRNMILKSFFDTVRKFETQKGISRISCPFQKKYQFVEVQR